MNWCVAVELALKGIVCMDVSNLQKITFMSAVVRSVTVFIVQQNKFYLEKYTDFKGLIHGGI